LIAATNQLPFDQFKRGVTSFNDLNPDLLIKTTTGTNQLKPAAHNNLQQISPAANNYTHDVWFLINGLSYSVTAEFCAIARSNNRGLFIGEETGGGYEGNTSAVQIDITLPATQMTVSFGTIQYNMAVKPVKPTGRGTIPDDTVLPTINDIGNKRDTQLERTLALVRSGK
jgi:spore coat protein U-like protein